MKDEEFDLKFKSKIKEDNEIPEKINQLFSKFEMEVKEMEENKQRTAQIDKMKKENKRMKRISIITTIIGIFGACGVAYATIVPQEWKINLTNLINSYFGIQYDTVQDDAALYNVGVQDRTLENIIDAEISNTEKYTKLLDADVYGIGDSNGGTLIESNYKQYDFNAEYGEEEQMTLQKYSDIVKIKLADVNYTCLEKLNAKNTISDQDGLIIERKESSIEEILEYQNEEFKNNGDNYFNDYLDGRTYNDLYFKITGMTIMNGNNTTDEDYNNYARAKKIKVTFNNEKEEIINLQDTKKAQFIDLDYQQNDISKPVDIKVEVLDTYKGNVSQDTYIADIQFGIDSNIPKGR